MPRAKPKAVRPSLAKTPTGIQGLDEVTGGGLPKGRVSLVCGNAGCGKSLLAMQFLVNGAVQYGEPGVCLNFEETEEKLTANVAPLGFDLRDLSKRNKLSIDYVSDHHSPRFAAHMRALSGFSRTKPLIIRSIPGSLRIPFTCTLSAGWETVASPWTVGAKLRKMLLSCSPRLSLRRS
jgi:replicative DNA helicase